MVYGFQIKKAINNLFIFLGVIKMLGTLTVETDWDFSLIIAGELFCDSEFSVEIYSIETLNSIQISGPFGSPTGGKTWEIVDALFHIRNNPTEFFSNLGGNRGAMWYPDGWVWSFDDDSERIEYKT